MGWPEESQAPRRCCIVLRGVDRKKQPMAMMKLTISFVDVWRVLWRKQHGLVDG